MGTPFSINYSTTLRYINGYQYVNASSTSFGALVNGAGNYHLNTQTGVEFRNYLFGGSYYQYINRGFLQFDLSSLPVGNVVSLGTITVRQNSSVLNGLTAADFGNIIFTLSNVSGSVTSDYENSNTAQAITNAYQLTYNNSGPYVINLLPNIIPTGGVVYIGFRAYQDYTNSQPSWWTAPPTGPPYLQWTSLIDQVVLEGEHDILPVGILTGTISYGNKKRIIYKRNIDGGNISGGGVI
jgi:hypothetical protein